MSELRYKFGNAFESCERSRQVIFAGRRRWEQHVRRNRLALLFLIACLLIGIAVGIAAGIGVAVASTTESKVFGYVLAEDGSAVGPGTVYVFSDDFGLIVTGLIERDGSYSAACGSGVWLLRFEVPGFQPELRYVSVQNAESNRLDVVLKRATSWISGTVVDPVGMPAAGALVVLFNRSHGVCVVSAQAGSDGSFSLEVAPGQYTVSVRSDLYAFEPRSVSVREGQQVEVTLVGRPSHVKVTGVTASEHAVPIGGAKVSVYTPSGRFVCSTKSGSDGRYVMYLPPGEWEIKAWADGWTHIGSELVIPRGAIDMNCDVVLQRSDSFISGIVVNDGGEPIPNAWIEVLDAQSKRWAATAYTDESGRFAFQIAGGDWILSLMADGYERTVVKVDAKPVPQILDTKSAGIASAGSKGSSPNVEEVTVIVMPSERSGLV